MAFYLKINEPEVVRDQDLYMGFLILNEFGHIG